MGLYNMCTQLFCISTEQVGMERQLNEVQLARSNQIRFLLRELRFSHINVVLLSNVIRSRQLTADKYRQNRASIRVYIQLLELLVLWIRIRNIFSSNEFDLFSNKNQETFYLHVFIFCLFTHAHPYIKLSTLAVPLPRHFISFHFISFHFISLLILL